MAIDESLVGIFERFEVCGFDLDPMPDKDVALIIEAFKSMLLRAYGMEHPFQKFSEEVFEDIDGDIVLAIDKIVVKP